MANRSYLYSTSQQSCLLGENNLVIKDLSEWNYDIPLSYFILVSGNSTLCPSLLTDTFKESIAGDHVFALSGDFNIGYARLVKFLSTLDVLFSKNEKSIKTEIQNTQSFLQQYKNNYIYLETIELDVMGFDESEQLKAQTLEYLDFAKQLANIIDSLPDNKNEAIELLAKAKITYLGNEALLLDNICIDHNYDCSDKCFLLGITEWTNNLYFTLNSKN
ncbi:DUF7822 domain-containing protein [Thorsellia kenyensis]|uniref:DUF7822 domain-containing protein n=1 Tax=Thorsellia kenyensis TaxID=1549888 RepID=A0ABV6C955_9GAMM